MDRQGKGEMNRTQSRRRLCGRGGPAGGGSGEYTLCRWTHGEIDGRYEKRGRHMEEECDGLTRLGETGTRGTRRYG